MQLWNFPSLIFVITHKLTLDSWMLYTTRKKVLGKTALVGKLPTSPVHSSPKGPFRMPALCFTLKLALRLPWWSHGLQGSVCVGWEPVHLVNKWYFAVVCLHTSPSVCSNRAAFMIAAFTFHTLGTCVCASVFAPYDSRRVMCECKPSSTQLAASERYQRKTWFPRAGYLFLSHL